MLRAFLKMVRERPSQDVPAWMQQAAASGIPGLKICATGIERDGDAVQAALRLPWSQASAEGKVATLQTVKRAGYGGAGFALLRQRLLHDAYWSRTGLEIPKCAGVEKIALVALASESILLAWS